MSAAAFAATRARAATDGDLLCAGQARTVVTCAAHFADAPALLTFALATLALAGLAWIVSFSTEQVGTRYGPAVTGGTDVKESATEWLPTNIGSA